MLMVNSKNAYHLILENITNKRAVKSIFDMNPTFLMEDIYSDRNYPPFNRITLDGVAIDANDIKNNHDNQDILTFNITSFQKAGEAPHTQKEPMSAIEVSTGGVLPIGMNCVIPYEKIDINNGIVKIPLLEIQAQKNIAFEGEDAKAKTLLIQKNQFLQPQHYAILASVGKTNVLALDAPKITIISTGDELVDASTNEKDILPHQIRRSNDLTIEAFLNDCGFNKNKTLHIKDDEEELELALNNAINNSDVVICSGGVSAGKKDFIKPSLIKCNADIIFHKIKQKPGKPLLFAKKDSTLIFGLPGNPVSSSICLRKYFIAPFFEKLQYKTDYNIFLDATLKKKLDFTFFIPVNVKNNSATVVKNNGSGDFINIGNSSGIIEINEEIEKIEQGEFSYLPWRIR